MAASGDCNDTRSDIHPDADEVCDTVDNDCDGSIDEGVASLWYADEDQDNYGDEEQATAACAPPTGYTPLGGDCDDEHSSVHPGAVEVCDDRVDEGVKTTWYADSDDDDYGNPLESTSSCAQPEGYVSNNQDCNDNNPDVNPGVEGTCESCRVKPGDADPATFETIQEALSAVIFDGLDCSNISVAAGTYDGPVQFGGAEVMVVAEEGPESTTIKGSSGAVIIFDAGEGADSGISGFTIESGTGRSFSNYKYGGGIFISYGSSPRSRKTSFAAAPQTMGPESRSSARAPMVRIAHRSFETM